MDVKKLGRIPDGGGWRAESQTTQNHRSRINKTRIGYDYVQEFIRPHCPWQNGKVEQLDRTLRMGLPTNLHQQ